MSFKDISYLEFWWPFCSAENHLCNFSRGYHEEQFCEIILNLDLWLRRRCLKKKFTHNVCGLKTVKTPSIKGHKFVKNDC